MDEVMALEKENMEEKKVFDDKLLKIMENMSENSKRKTEQEEKNGIIFNQLSQALINSLTQKEISVKQ